MKRTVPEPVWWDSWKIFCIDKGTNILFLLKVKNGEEIGTISLAIMK